MRGFVLTRRDLTVEGRLDPVHQAERRRLPHRRARSTLDETARGVPLAERGRIGDGGAIADHRTRRLDVGAGVEQRVEHLDDGNGKTVVRGEITT